MIHIIPFNLSKRQKKSKSESKNKKPNVKSEAVRRPHCSSTNITNELKGLCQNIAHMRHE